MRPPAELRPGTYTPELFFNISDMALHVVKLGNDVAVKKPTIAGIEVGTGVELSHRRDSLQIGFDS